MNAIEKRARELLAAEAERGGYPETAIAYREGMFDTNPSVRAVIAALTPPEGYVLVPVNLPEPMLDALYRAEGDMNDADMHALWADILAARPEVNQ